MEDISVDSSLAQVAEKITELKLEINERVITLKDILANKNISISEAETLLSLIQKVESEFTLNKNEINVGKEQIATSITNKGVTASGGESMSSLSEKIDQIRIGAVFS